MVGNWLRAMIDRMRSNQNVGNDDDRLQREVLANCCLHEAYPVLFILLSINALGSSSDS